MTIKELRAAADAAREYHDELLAKIRLGVHVEQSVLGGANRAFTSAQAGLNAELDAEAIRPRGGASWRSPKGNIRRCAPPNSVAAAALSDALTPKKSPGQASQGRRGNVSNLRSFVYANFFLVYTKFRLPKNFFRHLRAGSQPLPDDLPAISRRRFRRRPARRVR